MGNETSGERNFVDTNIFLYAVQAYPQFGKMSRAILERIDKGEKAVTSLINLAEICWWLERHGKSDQMEDELRLAAAVLNLELAPLAIEDFLLASRFVKEYKIDFNDCLALAMMKRLGVKKIYSNSPDFDRVGWIRREFR